MMDRTAVVSVVLGLTCFQAVAQSDTLAEHYAKTITEGELRTHLTILAADDYLGRETGKEGQKLAMEYLKQQFVRMGVPSVPKTANGRIDEWLERLAPFDPSYRHHRTGESNGDAHLKSLLVHHAVIVPVTNGALDLGPWQQVYYAEFDGMRRKRLVVKVLGE